MGGWYFVVKTIKGRRYRYQQRSWREGSRVRTQCVSLGPLDGREQPRRPYAPLPQADAVSQWEAGTLVALSPDDLNERERRVVMEYTGVEHHGRLNDHLRGSTPLGPETVSTKDRERLGALCGALEHPKARLTQDCTLYRKTLIATDQAQIGGEFMDLGFMSFGVNLEAVATHGVKSREGYSVGVLAIRGRAGERGYISVKGLTEFDNEKEILRYGGIFKIYDIVQLNNVTIYFIEEEGGYEIR